MFRPAFCTRRWARLWGLALIILLALPVGNVVAAPLEQEDAAVEPLLLGQYAYASVSSGESRIYEVTIPESGTYLVTAVDETSANAFDLVVTDAAGTVLYDDIFESAELTLDPGVLTLEFIAVEDGELWFVVLGQIGSMTDDPEQPGKLNTGSVYSADRVNEPIYGMLSVPETPYPQQVLIYVEPGEDDLFWVSAEGIESGYASISTEDANILHFWTHGGDYLITAEPMERRSSLTLIAFLSGRPSPITIDEPVEAVLSAGASEVVFELQLDTAFENLVLDVTSDEDLGVRLVDNYAHPEVDHDSYGEPMLEISDLFPGVYYLFVTAPEAAVADIPFTLSVSGDAGQALEVLESGVAAAGSFAEGQASITYSFEVAQAGALVEVQLESTSEDTDFDISAGLRPGEDIWSTYTYGSDDRLQFVAPVAGIHYITLKSNDGVGDYDVTATEGDLAPALENNTTVWGTIEPSSRNVYRLEVVDPGQLLVLALVGSPEVDLDLQVAAYNARGEQISHASASTLSSVEILSHLLTEPGIYEVTISAYFHDQSTNYFLRTQLTDPGLIAGQWAVDAVASSQYGDDSYAASQATGPRDTFQAGDYPTAWASSEADGGEQALELIYQYPVTPYAVEVYESYNPSAIVAVELYDAASDAWIVAWEGQAVQAEEQYQINLYELESVGVKTDRIRLVLDTDAIPGYNEIDAVQLFGRP